MKIYLKDKIDIYSTNGNMIRTLCAFVVIINHSFYLSKNEYDPLFILTNGQIGLGGFAVTIFFFFSGLYVTKSITKNKNYKSFMMSRCKRIFPQLWIVTFFSMFLLGPLFTTLNMFEYFTNIETYKYLFNCVLIPIHNLPGVFENNIYGQTVNGALWTLPVEFMCYITLLVITLLSKKLFNNQRLYIIFISVGLLLSAFLCAICEYLNLQLLKSAFIAISFFFVGSLYYLLKSKLPLNIIICVICIIGTIFSFFTPIANYLLLIFLPYLITFISLYPKQIKTKTKILNYSYEIYLIGWPIQQTFVSVYGGEMSILLNATLSITTACSIVALVWFCGWITKTWVTHK